MSESEIRRKSRSDEHTWAVFTGDFCLLKNFLSEREKPFWIVFQLLDALLRGFGQVVFANNPISGLLIAITLAATAPGTFVICTATAFLGLLLSVLMRDSQDNIQNGETVFNPLLVGAASYTLIPKIYGAFDAFSSLLLLLGTIFSVYLARSLGSDKFPCTAWPFNLAQLTMLFALATPSNSASGSNALPAISQMDNSTSDATDDAIFTAENVTNVDIDWGMVFRGFLTSPSQAYAVDSVISGSVIYLAVLIYSPITAGFAFLGALMGSFAGLQLGVPHDEVFSGFWGYNSLLTGACLGGNLFVINGQTAVATIVAIVYTAILQYAVLYLFRKIGLPILSIPFVLTASLFLKLRSSPNGTFPWPTSSSFPEKQRCDYLANRRGLLRQIDNADEPEAVTCTERGKLSVQDD